MKTNGFVYKKYAGMTVCTQTQEEPDLKVLHGRVVIDESDWKMLSRPSERLRRHKQIHGDVPLQRP